MAEQANLKSLWEAPDFIPVGPKVFAMFQKEWARIDKEKNMAHHQDWRKRHMNNMREMKAPGSGSVPANSAVGGKMKNTAGDLDSGQMTRVSASKEQGVNRNMSKWTKTGGPS